MGQTAQTPPGYLLLTIACFGAACGGGSNPPDPEGSVDGTPGVESTPASVPRRIGGFFNGDTGGPALEVCEGGVTLPLTGPALPDLLAHHQTLTSGQESQTPIFVDVLATLEPASTLHVLELRRAAFEGFGCQTVEEDLVARAGGNEPFWSVEVYDDRATFSTPEGSTQLEANSLVRSADGWLVTGTTVSGGGPFELTLSPGGCTDSMSGAWSHLGATLSLGDETYSGCGLLGSAGDL